MTKIAPGSFTAGASYKCTANGASINPLSRRFVYLSRRLIQMKKVLVTLALGAMLGTTAYAQSPVDRREQNQRERIQQGIKSGELTRPEARQLRVEEAKVRLAEAKAKK